MIDLESGLDTARNIGLLDGHIAAISADPLTGKQSIDVSGLVVAPGFIDLHTHSPTPLGPYYQLTDGVTTALELRLVRIRFTNTPSRSVAKRPTTTARPLDSAQFESKSNPEFASPIS